jgi:hypothetical protein
MKLLQQYNLKRVGPFVDVLYLTMPLFSVGAYSMSAITMYTVIMPWLKPVLPWLTLPVFFGFCFIGCLLLMGLMYKFVYKSYFAFRNNQEYKTDSPIRRDLEQIKEKLGIK